MPGSCFPRSTAAAALLVATSSVAAAPVSVTAEFLGFETVFQPDEFGGPAVRPLLVDGSLIAPDPLLGTVFLADPPYYGATYQQGAVALSPGSTRVEFIYDGVPAAFANAFEFTAVPAQEVVGVGTEFLLGTMTFTNGAWLPRAAVIFRLTTHSTDPALDGKTFDGRVRLQVNVDPDDLAPDPFIEADFFYIETLAGEALSSLGSVRVFDRAVAPPGTPAPVNVGSANLYGRIGSLVPTRFGDPAGGAYLSSSLAITGPTPPPPPPLPEPGSLALAGLGVIAAIAVRGRRARAGVDAG